MSGFQNQAPSLPNIAGINNIVVLNATVPPEGAKCVPVPVDLTTAAAATIDFTLMTGQDKMSGVQSIYLDNSANTATVTLNIAGTNQNVVCPARSCGIYPIVAANRPKIVVSSGGAVALVLLCLNVPLPANVWYPLLGEQTSGRAALTTVVTTGGTAVNVFNPPPNGGGVIVNPIAATESLFVDIVNAATTTAPGANGTTVELAAGQDFVISPNFGGVVSVNAVSNGHTFTAYGMRL